jgi:ABC-type sulfate transport system permease component
VAVAIWPYDVGILGRLSAITLSVIAILLSLIIALIFRLVSTRRTGREPSH